MLRVVIENELFILEIEIKRTTTNQH